MIVSLKAAAALSPLQIKLPADAPPIKAKLWYWSKEQNEFLVGFVDWLLNPSMTYVNPTARWASAPLLVLKLKVKFQFMGDLRPVTYSQFATIFEVKHWKWDSKTEPAYSIRYLWYFSWILAATSPSSVKWISITSNSRWDTYPKKNFARDNECSKHSCNSQLHLYYPTAWGAMLYYCGMKYYCITCPNLV